MKIGRMLHAGCYDNSARMVLANRKRVWIFARFARPVAACASLLLVHPSMVIAEDACVAIFDVSAGQTWYSDAEACARRVSPASTFKIPHALVALETGMVQVDTVERWDGSRFPGQIVWEQDHTIGSAIANSVVWFFQRTARRIGSDRMKTFLERFQYGNADTSGDVSMYWLNGTLRISGMEQLEFLKRLFGRTLPVDRDHVEHVIQSMRQQPGTVRNSTGVHKIARPWGNAELFAKTGRTIDTAGTGVSWLVGAVNRGERMYIFASVARKSGNIDPLQAARHALATLHERGLL